MARNWVALPSGTKLGPYEIQSPLGAGGMGEVYRALDTRLDRTVAIKILPADLCKSSAARQRFEREARVISSLNHPNICHLYDVGSQDEVDFIVMEFLDGETLAGRLKKGPLPLEQLLKYGIEICDGLEKAHKSGVVHRDLKPGNIMLTKSGAKLMDFGLAKAMGAVNTSPGVTATLVTLKDSPPLTAQGAVVGTFQYMAPEQLEGKEADAGSDIFALGAVLYEMATGRNAFEGKTPPSVMAAILEREPQPITAVQPSAPPALDRLVKTCLAKDREERWQTAHDVKLQLKAIAEDRSQVVSASATVGPSGAGPWKTREYVAWAAAAVAMVAALYLALAYSRREPPRVTQPMRTSLLPPPSFSFAPNNFAVSPDGARLAFVAVGPDGKDTLWAQVLSASGAQQLNGTEWASFPFWSPDSRHIGFFADGKLKTVDVAGGAVEILCEAPVGRGGTWSRDGTIVFAPFIVGPLYRVSASGGVPTPVTTRARQASGQGHRWPFFLPDHKHFLYHVDWSAPEDTQGNGIYVGSLDSREAKLISSDLSGNVVYTSGHLLYVRDRSLMAQPFSVDRLESTGPPVPLVQQQLQKDMGFSESGFSASSENGVLVFQSAADSPSRLVWFDSSGRELEQLPGGGYRDPRISPDGRFLAAASDDEHNGRYYVRIYDLARGFSTRLSDVVIYQTPIWSRDGKKITYSTPTDTIEQIASDGVGSAQVLLKGAHVVANDWSRDGHLVFMDSSKGFELLRFYSATDRRVTELVGWAGEGQFSADGKWIAYQLGSTGSGRLDIFVQPFPGPAGRIQISSDGGAQPRWSRDGRQMFYIQPDRKLMTVSFDPRKGTASAPRVVFQTRIVAPSYASWQYDVSPDGRFLINSFPSKSSSPLSLLSGWTALVKP